MAQITLNKISKIKIDLNKLPVFVRPNMPVALLIGNRPNGPQLARASVPSRSEVVYDADISL